METLTHAYRRAWLSWGIKRIYFPPAPAASMTEAVYQNRLPRRTPKLLSHFQLLGARQWEDRVIVVYHIHERTLRFKRQDWLGYGVVRKTSAAWERDRTAGTVEYGYNACATGPLLKNGMSTRYAEPQHMVMVGRVQAPLVARAEATLATGEILQDISHDGIFVLVANEATYATELRLFDHDGDLIFRRKYEPPPHTRDG